jgi:hypothetical protein
VSHGQLTTPRRGYLANPLVLPPIVYPFQYNPAQLTDTKRVEWGERPPRGQDRGAAGLASGLSGAASALRSGGLGALGGQAGPLLEYAGRTFSGAQLKRFQSEGERTLNFQFHVDGRERRPGEPPARRNADGDILADLALLRSFVYPAAVEWTDLVSAFVSGESLKATQFFHEPPTALLILGDLSMEGFVSDLRITETQFNAGLDPVRADVDITLVEKIDSLSFVVDSLKRFGRAAAYTSYDDLPHVIA